MAAKAEDKRVEATFTQRPQSRSSLPGCTPAHWAISGCSEAAQQTLNLGLEQTAMTVKVEKGVLVDLYCVVRTS